MRIRLRSEVIKENYLLQKKRYNKILEGIIDLYNINDSGFARHNPKISEYCLKSPENLIQALIFCVASQGVSWNVVAPLYRVMYQKLLRDGTLYIKGKETELVYEPEGWKELLGNFGKNKIIAIDYMWKHQKQIFYTTKEILKDWYYPSPENLEKQEKMLLDYEEKLKNVKTEKEIDLLIKEYSPKIKSIQDSRDSVMRLFDYFTSLPGLGIVKAGFAVQLICGALGCFDSVNTKLYFQNPEIPEELKKVRDDLLSQDKKTGEWKFTKKPSDSAKFETRVELLKKYSDFLDLLGTEVKKPTSERLWDVWVTIVSDRIRNIFGKGKQEDRPTILKKGDLEVARLTPYNPYKQNPDIVDWEKEHSTIMTPDLVSAQHHPTYLAYGEYTK